MRPEFQKESSSGQRNPSGAALYRTVARNRQNQYSRAFRPKNTGLRHKSISNRKRRHPSALCAKDVFSMREAWWVRAQPARRPKPPKSVFEGPLPEEYGSEAQSISNRKRRHPSALRAKDAFSMREANRVQAPPAAKRDGCGHSSPVAQNRQNQYSRAFRPKNTGLRHRAPPRGTAFRRAFRPTETPLVSREAKWPWAQPIRVVCRCRRECRRPHRERDRSQSSTRRKRGIPPGRPDRPDCPSALPASWQ